MAFFQSYRLAEVPPGKRIMPTPARVTLSITCGLGASANGSHRPCELSNHWSLLDPVSCADSGPIWSPVSTAMVGVGCVDWAVAAPLQAMEAATTPTTGATSVRLMPSVVLMRV